SGGRSGGRGTSAAKGAQMLTDHDEIRRWAEERNAKPACVMGTGGGGDTGMLRLDFPGYSGADSLRAIDWDEWFEKFDDNNLALGRSGGIYRRGNQGRQGGAVSGSRV